LSGGGEESNKSNKEDFNFFSNSDPPEEKNIKVDIKEINTSSTPSISDPIITENKVYGNDLIGVDLLANTSKKIEEGTDNVSNNGYSSGGEESNKSNKEDFNFFADKPQEKNINVEINDVAPPIVDPIIENKSNSTGGEFKSIHSMTPNDIKNEKIEILYKFRKLEGQGIRPTMNYNMNSNLEDMRSEYYKLKKQRETDNSVKFQRKI
jgi:ribosomal protein S18